MVLLLIELRFQANQKIARELRNLIGTRDSSEPRILANKGTKFKR